MGKRTHGVRNCIACPYVFETHESIHFWNTIPWSLLSFFSKEEWKVAKEEVAGQ